MPTKLFLKLITIAVFITLIGFYFFYIKNIENLERNITTFQELYNKNENFRQGNKLIASGNNKASIKFFEKALLESENFKQEGQIKFKIASAKKNDGDIVGAINTFKEIVANQNYDKFVKAYAIEHMVIMFHATSDKNITEEIFKDEPYKSFLKNNDISLAYDKELSEYGSSFYPLGISEGRIAGWYANQILKMKESGSNSPDDLVKIERMKNVIRNNFKNIDLDISRTENDPNSKTLNRGALDRKAVVVGKMLRTGDSSFGDPEKMFKQVIDLYALGSIKNYDGFVIFHYATFLANMYGEKRKDDIKKLLSNYYSTDDYKGSQTFTFLSNEKDNVAGVRNDILLLAKIDPQFKDLLVSLGWKF